MRIYIYIRLDETDEMNFVIVWVYLGYVTTYKGCAKNEVLCLKAILVGFCDLPILFYKNSLNTRSFWNVLLVEATDVSWIHITCMLLVYRAFCVCVIDIVHVRTDAILLCYHAFMKFLPVTNYLKQTRIVIQLTIGMYKKFSNIMFTIKNFPLWYGNLFNYFPFSCKIHIQLCSWLCMCCICI